MENKLAPRYTKKEEFLNTITHALGIVLSLVSLIYLIYKAVVDKSVIRLVGFSVYGICLTLMFLSSTLYHGIRNERVKKYLRLLDHCAIFLCIAGTYTPIALLSFKSNLGFVMLTLVWILAISGIVMKVYTFFKSKFNKMEVASLVLYLLMGWISVFFIKEMIINIGLKFFSYILLGGIFYSVGVFFYSNKKIKFNHFIWHIFILLGSMSMNIGIIKFL